ncbi:MAG: cob(I)yrinic acid a,c-diamide adenosyltransferase [Pseudomonadota bacterium]
MTSTHSRTGLVQVYTGTGKGKTTAALGLVLRAVGKGQRALVIQFMKGQTRYGEIEAIGALAGATIEQYGRPDFVDRRNPAAIDRELAEQGLARARLAVSSGEYDLVVLDELNVALDYGLVREPEALEVISSRQAHVEVVVTGRSAPASIIDLADLVTVMAEVKHPYAKGVPAREGIEY